METTYKRFQEVINKPYKDDKEMIERLRIAVLELAKCVDNLTQIMIANNIS